MSDSLLETRDEEKLFRIPKGRPIPDGWTFKAWLGVETSIHYAPHYEADVVLLTRKVPK